MFTKHQWATGKDHDPVAQWVQSMLENFVNDTPALPCPVAQACLWVDERHNLWFQGKDYKKPSLLAVRTKDGAMNIRTSGSDQKQLGKGPYQEWIQRSSLKLELVELCKKAKTDYDLVAKLTPRKATEQMLVRVTSGRGFDDFGL